MKLKYLLKLKNINQKELAEKTNLSEPLLSKFNNYVCLPTPRDMDMICKALDCEVLDMYDKDEILFIKPKKKRKSKELNFYRLTVTLPGYCRRFFSKEYLNYIGYGNLECLMFKVAERLIHAHHMKEADCSTEQQYNEYLEEQEELEKKELDAGTSNSNVVS